MSQSKMSAAAAVATGLVVLNAGLSFVAPRGAVTAPRMSGAMSELDLAGSTDAGFGFGTAVAVAAAGVLALGARSLVARKATLHGIKFDYALQKDAYADLEFMNDVGYLPDGTPMNRAGNAVNHPETIGPDPHSPGSPLPRAEFTNSVGYLPDGTPMNRAGNAINHPETIGPDLHTPGSPLPASYYAASMGYLVDGTDMAIAGNLSVQGGAAIPPPAVSTPLSTPMAAPAMGGASMGGEKSYGRGFDYQIQKDAYADLQFGNDVGYLCDGTPMNTAGNNTNHPETIGPDPHSPGSPLPRALFVNDIGYLPDGTPMNMAGNAINHPETIGPDTHTPGSPLPASHYAADIGYLVDGTDIATAGNNAIH